MYTLAASSSNESSKDVEAPMPSKLSERGDHIGRGGEGVLGYSQPHDEVAQSQYEATTALARQVSLPKARGSVGRALSRKSADDA